METYQSNFPDNRIDNLSNQTNDETKLFINLNDKSGSKNINIDQNLNNSNNFNKKKLFIPNLNLNGLSEKNTFSNFYEDEININDFLGRKRENNQKTNLNLNKIEIGIALKIGHNAEIKNGDFNNNDFNKEENKNNKKIYSTIKKIGAKIIKASPTHSPISNRKIDFSEEKKIKVEFNESVHSQMTNESKITEDLETQNNICNNNHHDEVNFDTNANLNNAANELLEKLNNDEKNQINLNLNENQLSKITFICILSKIKLNLLVIFCIF
jgi:hypothetical protein